ncbi:MAG: hypothetical protein KDB80_11275 [Planctomycetes bacterium]|nr:hypothetical protein [Planctomycetota bacterium]
MKPVPLTILCTILASAISIAVTTLVLGDRGVERGPILSEDSTALAERVQRLESDLEQARRELQTIANRPEPARAEVPEVDPDLIDRAVERYLAAGGQRAIDAMAAKQPPEPGAFDPKATLQDLRTVDRSWEEVQAVFSKLSDEQKDAVLAEFEIIAKASPNDPNIQNELGEAYVHRLMNADMLGMMKYGQLAERQFDRALELDDHHWGARFNKAMSLSNQPAFLGRRPEAIKHFETLMTQQESAPPEGKHAQTYLFLGNLYAQSGKPDQAKEIWERGLSRFPEAKALLQKLGR